MELQIYHLKSPNPVWNEAHLRGAPAARSPTECCFDMRRAGQESAICADSGGRTGNASAVARGNGICVARGGNFRRDGGRRLRHSSAGSKIHGRQSNENRTQFANSGVSMEIILHYWSSMLFSVGSTDASTKFSRKCWPTRLSTAGLCSERNKYINKQPNSEFD